MKKMRETEIKEVIFSAISVVLVCLFPTVFLLFNNIGQVRVAETIMPMLVSAVIGGIIWLIFSFVLRSFVDGAICGMLICLLGFNYGLIEKGVSAIMPMVKYWHLLPVLFFVLAITTMSILDKLDYSIRKDITFVCMVVIVGLTVFNIIKAVPQIITINNQSDSKDNVVKINTQSNNGDIQYPNIYWLIFDEYSNFDVLEKYFDYDNTEFGSFLEEKGFTVSYDSENESYETKTILSNYMALDYITNDDVALTEREEIMRNGIVFELLESFGYTISAIQGGNHFGLTGEQPVASSSISGEDFSALIFKNTVIYPFVTKDAYENAQIYMESFATLKNPEKYLRDEPQLSLGYFVLPHQPFLFDEKGDKVPLSHINDWYDTQYYLNQLIYTTAQIEEVVDAILQYDEDSIIIIQSDHSARGLRTKEGDYVIEDNDKRHFLNAVYFGGQNLEEIKGKSGVNTLRIIFGKLLNLELPEVEVPVVE